MIASDDPNANETLDKDGNIIPAAQTDSTSDADGDSQSLSYGEQAAADGQAALDAAQAAKSVMPEDNIPGWTETASGTLLDSYYTPELELDEKR